MLMEVPGYVDVSTSLPMEVTGTTCPNIDDLRHLLYSRINSDIDDRAVLCALSIWGHSVQRKQAQHILQH